MSQPLLNDFGVPMEREKAKAALRAAGWRQAELNGNLWFKKRTTMTPVTLREAWAEHTARGDRR